MRGLKIGSAGIRGPYPAALSPAAAGRFALAYGRLLPQETMFVGRDTRPSGAALVPVVAAALRRAGKRVKCLGIVPTPAVQYAVEEHGAAGGVVVTASHNPLPDNGLKFLSPEGSFLAEEQALRLAAGAARLRFAPGRPHAPRENDDGLMERYFAAIAAAVDIRAIRARRFTVVVDPVQGVGAIWSRTFLVSLGCRVTLVNSRPRGVFSRNPEPLPGHLGRLCSAVATARADIGFAQDPDGDRLALVTEDGIPAGEELTLALAAERALARGRTPIVVNLSTSAVMEHVAARWGVPLFRARVGEANVATRMREVGSRFGGEGNGGVIWPAVHAGRDSFVAMALILELLAKRRAPVSRILRGYPPLVMIKRRITAPPGRIPGLLAAARRRFAAAAPDLTDGVRVSFREGWIHIRPSGTEPVVRIIAEGTGPEAAAALLARAGDACGRPDAGGPDGRGARRPRLP